MTVSTVYAPDTYAGDDSTTSFAITFNYQSTASFIKVSIKTNSTGAIELKSSGTHYNVSSDNVVFTSGNTPATGETVIIELSPDFLQQTDYVEGDTFPAASHEAALDKRTLESHINKDLVGRALQVDAAVSGFSQVLTDPTLHANKYLKLNNTGTEIGYATITATGGLANVVDDTTPALGGNLDVNGFTITSASNGNVTINPNGSGTTIIHANVTFDDTNVAYGPHGTSAGNTYETRFLELLANGTNYVGFKAADTLAGNQIWTLPTADGSQFQTIATNGSGVLSFQNAGILQEVSTQTGAVATGTTQMPADDTIPQNTEGDEYMTLSITPKSATSKLKIEVEAVCGHSAATTLCLGLFQDSTADALAATSLYAGANENQFLSLKHYMTSGTTSSTTFKVRIGGHGAGTATFNGSSATRIFGGVAASSITITEIQT